MAVLLDTHAFLWWCEDAKDLSRVARRSIGRGECFLSLASIWEMAIKVSLGKLKLPGAFDRYIPEQMVLNGFSQLEIGFRHAARTAHLPWHHRDPFDRVLIAQSLENDLGVVSRDPVFERYGVRRIW
ncbi:MAG: type II toxin-antitoxin system VapC family toxin [Bryobacteraceae bacterium]